jgi:anti-sigma factor RsiW
MTACPGKENLLNGLIDGELDAVHIAEIEAHIAGCAGCAKAHADLLELRAALRADDVRVTAPASLKARLEATLRAAEAAETTPLSANVASFPRRRRWARWELGLGGALAAACAAVVVLVAPGLQTAGLQQQLVDNHVRSLLAGHLIDVATSDKHVVKPWFNGKTDFSPPVIDLAADGYPLVGGRLDYVNRRVVAAVVYKRRLHVINLFMWPDRVGGGPAQAEFANGYRLRHWARGGMTYWAVSDVDAASLKQFEQLQEAKGGE